MKLNGPIIMSLFSVTPLAPVDKPATDNRSEKEFLLGSDAVLIVDSWAKHGDSALSTSELWKPLQPNMWLAMSLKK